MRDAMRNDIPVWQADALRSGPYVYNPRYNVMVAPTQNDVNLYLTRPLTTPERVAATALNVGAAAQGPIQRLREGASRLMQSMSKSRQRPP